MMTSSKSSNWLYRMSLGNMTTKDVVESCPFYLFLASPSQMAPLPRLTELILTSGYDGVHPALEPLYWLEQHTKGCHAIMVITKGGRIRNYLNYYGPYSEGAIAGYLIEEEMSANQFRLTFSENLYFQPK